MNYLYSHFFSQSLHNNQKNHHSFISLLSLFFCRFSFLCFIISSGFCWLLWLNWLGIFGNWFLLLLWLRRGAWFLGCGGCCCWFSLLLSCGAFLLCLLWLSGFGFFSLLWFRFLFFWFSSCCCSWLGLLSQFRNQFVIFFFLLFSLLSSGFLFSLLDLLSSNSDVGN